MDFFRKYGIGDKAGFALHLAPYRRETQHAFPIETIGYIPKKTDYITHTFDTLNFSFILKGSGTYDFGGRTFTIEAPCVLTQPPGIPMRYGPLETWEELYLIYNRGSLPALQKRGYYTFDKPFWNISDANVLDESCAILGRLLNTAGELFAVDKIDLACEMLILASISHSAMVRPSREEQLVRELEARIRKDFLADYDFSAIAREHGLHPATFRRYWNDYCPVPPGRFVMHLRLNEACRMLVETDQTISEIAYALRFDDPLYFSRLFRKQFGCTATDYRYRNQSGLHPIMRRQP